MPEKITRSFAKSFAMKFDEDEFARAINGNKEIAPAFRRLHLGNIDVKEADRSSFELLLPGHIAPTSASRDIPCR